MSKRPAFQLYPADWKNNAKLRRCSEAARGALIDIMGTLHDSDEYGVVRWPLADLARAAGVSMKSARELATKGPLKGSDGAHEAYVYTPRSGGRDGEPVTLIDAGDGPCWYSSRMVRDEWVRSRRGVATQFSADNQPPSRQPKPEPKATPKPPIGERQGDGPSTSSSSSTSKVTTPSSSLKPPIERVCEALGVSLNDDPQRLNWPAQLRAMLDAGLDLERDVLPACAEAKARAIANLQWVRKRAEAEKAKRIVAEQVTAAATPIRYTDEAGWAQRLQRYAETGIWLDAWGPPRGAPGHLCDEHFWTKYHRAKEEAA